MPQNDALAKTLSLAMHPLARLVAVQDVLPLRTRYREEMNCQIVHDSIHSRKGWSLTYALDLASGVAGFGSVAIGGPWKDKPTVFEFYLVPEHRARAFALFEAFLAASGARGASTHPQVPELACDAPGRGRLAHPPPHPRARHLAPDPQLLMRQFVSWDVASRETKWAGRNITRWRHEEYDRLWKSAEHEMDPVKRAAMFIRMNDAWVTLRWPLPQRWARRRLLQAKPSPAQASPTGSRRFRSKWAPAATAWACSGGRMATCISGTP